MLVVDLRGERRALSLKSGIRSRKAEGSSTAPDSMCAPASRAFSSTAIASGSPPALLQLRQPQRGRHAGRPAADDQDVDFESLAVQKLHSRAMAELNETSQRRSFHRFVVCAS